MILRDPVHGLVAFDATTEQHIARLIDTREVQRLRRVRMLGVASLVFPSAEHSRFVHAVGATHVMQRYLARLRVLARDLAPAHRMSVDDEQLALAAALLHDVGHGPLSHLFEEVFHDAVPHESWTSRLVLDPSSEIHACLREVDPTMPARVERLIHGVHPRGDLASAVSGRFDVDRCDYLLRDSYMTGVRYGLFDLDWLLGSLRLHVSGEPARVRLVVDGSKGLPAVEGFFLARLFMYEQVYFHKAARAAEVMVRSAFARAAELARNGAGAAMLLPPSLAAMARGDTLSTHEYLALDDAVLWACIDRWRDAPDATLAAVASRLSRRQLFKTASLHDDQIEHADELLAGAREIARRAGFDSAYFVSLDVADMQPYDDEPDDEGALQVAYANRDPQQLTRASFLIQRLAGETLWRRRLVFPEEVRDKVLAMLGRKVH